MKIPHFWARANSDAEGQSGAASPFFAWGWSDDGQAEAESHARQRLASLIARFRAGEPLPRGYAYGNRPFREEVVQEHGEPGDAGQGVVTRNAYGCLVLNAAQVVFLDVDLPEPAGGGLLRGLFGGKKPSPEEQVRGQIRELLERQRAASSFRLYRTAAGFRVLLTDEVLPPGDPAAAALLADPIVDRAYATLCRVQRSYRARLTPKPWRCGSERPPSRFPFPGESDRQAFEGWLRNYEGASEGWATCPLVEEVGGGRVHPEVAPLLQLHDRIARVGSGLPLA